MKLSFAGDRVLAVVAHPDDAELLCAGTLARAKSEGAQVAICVLCKGDKGQPAKPVRNLAARRLAEVRKAASLLGAEHYSLGVPDSTLADVPAVRKKLVEVFRLFRPTLVLAHNADDYHPDHRAAGALAEAASWSCASRGYLTKSRALPCSPALWWMDTLEMGTFQPGFFIDISKHADVKIRMLECHATQLSRGVDGDFAPLRELMQRQSAVRGTQAGVSAAEAFAAYSAFRRARAW